MGRRAARPRALRLRAAAVLDPRPRHRGRGAAGLRAVRHGRDPLEPARGRLALGQIPQGAGAPRAAARRGSRSATTSRCPENQRKLEAAEELARLAEEAGLTLIELALAFVLRHPAVTSAIIGPRTMEQLEGQLGAADVELSADVLDAIDEIVPPGTNLNPADAGLAAAAPGRPCDAPALTAAQPSADS